jgi:hypothetical protein
LPSERPIVHRSGRRHADIPEPCRPGQSWTVVAVPPLSTRMLRGVIGDRSSNRVETSPSTEGLAADHVAQPAQIGLDAVEAAVVERRLHRRMTASSRDCVHDQLGEHRVVEGADLAPAMTQVSARRPAGSDLSARPMSADSRGPGPRRRAAPGSTCRAGSGRFGVEEGEVAGRAAHHPLDEIDAHHLFGDAMLDLEPGVHLQEEEVLAARRRRGTRPCRPSDSWPLPRRTAAAIRRARVAGRRARGPPRRPSGCGAAASSRARPGPRRGRRRRRKSAPRRGGRGGHSVRGRRRIAEIAGARRATAAKPSRTAAGVLADPHADAAAAGCGLQDDREADPRRRLGRFRRIRQQVRCRAPAARHGLGQARALCFRPKARILSGVGPMKAMPAAAHASAKSAFSARKP